MKIYTKTGDKGETALFGGKRVPKHHIRIEAYGTVDETNSFIGLIRDQEIDEHSKEMLTVIQDRLFTIGSLLASDPEKKNLKVPRIKEEDIKTLEDEIDQMNDKLPEMRSFILPGGHTTVSYCHISRCVCRRAERLATALHGEEAINPLIIQYLNRLSDYLFVLARKLSKDLRAEEVPWKPRM